jgi:hemolysin activation/secretion protein
MKRSDTTRRLDRVFALLLLSTVALGAQAPVPDNGHIAPKPVPPAGPSPTVQPAPATPVSGANAGEVIIPKLKALVFVPTPPSVNKSGVSAKGIVLQNVTVPAEADFRTLTSGYLGQKLTRGKLNTLISDIILYYRQHDRPIVDVIVPAQEVTNGVLQVALLEGKMGKVTVTGNHWFSSSEIADGVTVHPGQEISAHDLQANLDWINQNPFRTSDLVYHPGEKLGETDLVLQTHDRFPVRVYAGYEDSGNAPTGFDRYLAGFNYGDLFGIGQQVNYQYTTSGDGDSLRAHSGSYIIPLPWQHTLTFFGSYVDTKGSVPPLIGLTGRSYQISGRYTVPLPTINFRPDVIYKHSFGAGFDYKYNDNSLEFGGVAVPGTLYDVDQFVMSYNGTLTDPYGQLTINDQLYVSPGAWGGNNNDMAFALAHANATSDYVYNTLILERLTKLPEDFTLVLRGTLQTSNANLTPSEQLGLGGYDTVRGYDEREVNADEGYIFTTELRSPPVSLGDTFGFPAFKDQLQFLGFWDYGVGYNHIPLPGEASEFPLSSVGLGVRYSINTYVSVRFDYGFQLLSTGLDNDHGSRSDLGIVVSY